MATITVYYKPVVIGVTTPYFHEFLIYSPDSSSSYSGLQIARGGPVTNQNISLDSGGGSGSSGGGSGSGGTNVPFGHIVTYTGPYRFGILDYTPDLSQYHSAQITSGPSSQLDSVWSNLANFVSAIDSQNIPYGIAGPNTK
jgi:hypothetical protein